MSIAKTVRTLSANVVMMRSVNDWEPSFSYHATVSSIWDAESASTSPSPSTSIAKTDVTIFASSVMMRSEKATLVQKTVGRGVGDGEGAGVDVGAAVGENEFVGACVPQSFSYQATVFALRFAESTSTSPSSSTSIAKTDLAPSAFVVMSIFSK